MKDQQKEKTYSLQQQKRKKETEKYDTDQANKYDQQYDKSQIYYIVNKWHFIIYVKHVFLLLQHLGNEISTHSKFATLC